MKFQAALLSLFVAASMAAPTVIEQSNMKMNGTQLKSLLDAYKAHGVANPLAADASINCDITYTLALSNILQVP